MPAARPLVRKRAVPSPVQRLADLAGPRRRSAGQGHADWPLPSGANAGGIDARDQDISAKLRKGFCSVGFSLRGLALARTKSRRLKPTLLEKVASWGLV